ncbi:MAG: zinc ribbon domain-containing protein [Bacillus subtilis]|nr:zinc ribbon domain-containing protein [Bacillus subtilis]
MDKYNLNENPKAKKVFRFVGPILLGVGILLITAAFIDFFVSMASMSGMPSLFFLFFLAMPFLMAGAIMTNLGYMGTIGRYTASQVAPIAKDVTNYMIDGTKDSIIDLADGVLRGKKDAAPRTCGRCGEVANPGAVFCDACGTPLIKKCQKCNEQNDFDAAFCQRCGERL